MGNIHFFGKSSLLQGMKRYYTSGWVLLWFVMSVACLHTKRIVHGDDAYALKRYAQAVELYKLEYQREKDRDRRAYLAYRIGLSWLKQRQPQSAVAWFDKSLQHRDQPIVAYNYALSLIQLEQYDQARELLIRLRQKLQDPTAFQLELQSIQLALRAKQQYIDTNYRIERMPINSPFHDLMPVALDGQRWLFTSDRAQSSNEPIYAWTGNPYFDIYVWEATSHAVQKLPVPINSPHNEGTPAPHPKEKLLVFVRCTSSTPDQNATCKLMASTQQGTTWTEPVILPFVDERYNYTTPSWSADGSYLYFASDIEGGQGGFDLYRVSYTNGQWGEPENLGTAINTPDNELYPMWSGDTLAYSSDALPSFGGLDIYLRYIDPQTGRYVTEHLGFPYNSGGDDVGFLRLPVRDTTTVLSSALVSSTRAKGGIGGYDIYRIDKMRLRRKPTPPKPKPHKPTRLYLALRTLRPAGDSLVDLRNDGLRPLPEVYVRMGEELKKTDRQGLLILPLKADTVYDFILHKKGYLRKRFTLSTKDSSLWQGKESYTYSRNVWLLPLREGVEIVIPHIYYDFDRWNIRRDARPTLDSLAELLKLNPHVVVEISAHTDCIGADAYNDELSRKRAESVVAYLVQKGIPSERLRAKGYGERYPLVPCQPCERCTPEQRQRNRRTSFRIVQIR